MQKKSSFQQLKQQSEMIKKYHENKVPIIVKKASGSKLRDLTNNKILILKTFNVYKLIMVIKKKIQLDKSEAIYLFINNNLLQAGQTLDQVYDKYVAQDGFLHIEYFQYATFGSQ